MAEQEERGTYGHLKRVWRRMAEQSKADGPGGSQWRRCLAAWLATGKPDPETFVPDWLLADDRAGAGPAPGA